MGKITTISGKSEESSYVVAKIMVKNMKLHAITESVIFPACCKIGNIIFGEEYEKEVLKVLMSDNTCLKMLSHK
jgi:hypothetical protein